jgi:hypothetical protein
MTGSKLKYALHLPTRDHIFLFFMLQQAALQSNAHIQNQPPQQQLLDNKVAVSTAEAAHQEQANAWQQVVFDMKCCV